MIADQLLCRLQAIHAKGVIHRDVKPGNLLMGLQRQGNTVYVTDLGLAFSDKINNIKSGAAKKSRGLLGTATFASINGHMGEGTTQATLCVVIVH